MFKGIKLLALASVVGLFAACTQEEPEEFVVVDPEPISTEPVYTGKYK